VAEQALAAAAAAPRYPVAVLHPDRHRTVAQGLATSIAPPLSCDWPRLSIGPRACPRPLLSPGSCLSVIKSRIGPLGHPWALDRIGYRHQLVHQALMSPHRPILGGLWQGPPQIYGIPLFLGNPTPPFFFFVNTISSKCHRV
jgi:hypothetical protein